MAGTPVQLSGETESAWARRTLHRAVERHSKPQVALRIIEALDAARSPGVPPAIAHVIAATVALARGSARR